MPSCDGVTMRVVLVKLGIWAEPLPAVWDASSDPKTAHFFPHPMLRYCSKCKSGTYAGLYSFYLWDGDTITEIPEERQKEILAENIDIWFG